jgi:hypothetical protein
VVKGKTSDKNDANYDLENENLGNKLEEIEIPRPQITREEMEKRKCMDQRRWMAMARPQYPKSCGISSLTSVFNYLFSWLGAGDMRPISTEEALEALGFNPPYTNVNFGSFTGNDTLIAWFGLLCRNFKVKGKAKISWKLHGKSQTPGIDKEQALENLMEGLNDPKRAYIYHCYNHYMCPIGYERTPIKPMDAYKKLEDIEELDTWLIIGEISKAYPMFHVKKWKDVAQDIDCAMPYFFNIRKSDVGVQEKTAKCFQPGGSKEGGNLHCFIEFERLEGVYVDPKGQAQFQKENILKYAEKKRALMEKAQ